MQGTWNLRGTRVGCDGWPLRIDVEDGLYRVTIRGRERGAWRADSDCQRRFELLDLVATRCHWRVLPWWREYRWRFRSWSHARKPGTEGIMPGTGVRESFRNPHSPARAITAGLESSPDRRAPRQSDALLQGVSRGQDRTPTVSHRSLDDKAAATSIHGVHRRTSPRRSSFKRLKSNASCSCESTAVQTAKRSSVR